MNEKQVKRNEKRNPSIRHCEEAADEAIQSFLCVKILDCRVATPGVAPRNDTRCIRVSLQNAK